MIFMCVKDWKDESDLYIKCMEVFKNLNWFFIFENIEEDILVYNFVSRNNYRNVYCGICNRLLRFFIFW